VNNAERARFIPATVLGMSHDYANFTQWLKDNLVPQHAAEFRAAENQCFDSNNNQFTGMDMNRFFKNNYSSLLWDPIPKTVRDSTGIMGQRGTPKAPWYLYEVCFTQLIRASYIANTKSW
jgi:hypothetical protein